MKAALDGADLEELTYEIKLGLSNLQGAKLDGADMRELEEDMQFGGMQTGGMQY